MSESITFLNIYEYKEDFRSCKVSEWERERERERKRERETERVRETERERTVTPKSLPNQLLYHKWNQPGTKYGTPCSLTSLSIASYLYKGSNKQTKHEISVPQNAVVLLI